MNRFADFFARRRGPVVLFVLLLSALAAWGNSVLSFSDVPRAIFASDDIEHERLLEYYETFGADDADVIFVLEAADWFTAENLGLLRGLAERAGAVEGVEAVVSLADVVVFDGFVPRPLLPGEGASAADLREAAARAHLHPLVEGRLLSPDGRLVMMVLRMSSTLERIEDLRPRMLELRTLAREMTASTGVIARTTGIPIIRVEIFDAVRSEQALFMGLGALFCVLLAWLFFRDLASVVAAVLPAGLGAFWAMGSVGLIGGQIDLLGSVLSTIVLVIGFTDSVHFVMDVRRSLHAGLGRLEATVDALRHVGVPCLLTSLTTAVGFASLTVSDIAVIRTFGALAAMGVIVAFVGVLSSVPLMVLYLPRMGAARRPCDGGATPWERRAGALIDAVSAHGRAVSVAGVGLTLVAALLCVRLVPENRLTEALPRGESYDALVRAEEVFGGVLPIMVVVGWNPESPPSPAERFEVLGEVETMLSALPGAHAPLSARTLAATLPLGAVRPAEALALLPRALVERYYNAERGQAVVEAMVADGDGHETRRLFGALRAGVAALAQRHGGFEFHPTGTDYVARSNVNRMIVGLARSLGFAALVIFGVIAFEFRSLRLGLISLLPNVFPLVFIGALLALSTGAMQMASAVLFTVLLGLAVDDTIHFLARYRRELRRGLSNRDAVRESFLRVGQAVGVTTIVLVSGFAAVAFSSVPSNQAFALYISLGLCAALIGDLLLLPALLAAFPGRERDSGAS